VKNDEVKIKRKTLEDTSIQNKAHESLYETYPAKLICGVLYHDKFDQEAVLSDLEKKWGKIDFCSEVYPFSDSSTYYKSESGEKHHRIFVSFEGLVQPGNLPRIKNETIEMETSYGSRHDSLRRPVNLDPGLIMRGRLVLATTKDFSHRLYLGEGIYGEVTLLFKKKRIENLAWTYPDIKSGRYQEMLLAARAKYESDCLADPKWASANQS
jgi:hypothetical protein